MSPSGRGVPDSAARAGLVLPAWVAVALVGAAAVTFFAGFALSARSATSGAGSQPTASAQTLPPLPSADTGVLTLLQHRPLSIDRPAIPTGSRLVQTSFRLVDAGSVASLYVARSLGGDVCLVAVTADQQFASTCAAPQVVQKTALELRFMVVPSGPADRRTLVARLDPDGSADLTTLPRA